MKTLLGPRGKEDKGKMQSKKEEEAPKDPFASVRIEHLQKISEEGNGMLSSRPEEVQIKGREWMDNQKW